MSSTLVRVSTASSSMPGSSASLTSADTGRLIGPSVDSAPVKAIKSPCQGYHSYGPPSSPAASAENSRRSVPIENTSLCRGHGTSALSKPSVTHTEPYTEQCLSVKTEIKSAPPQRVVPVKALKSTGASTQRSLLEYLHRRDAAKPVGDSSVDRAPRHASPSTLSAAWTVEESSVRSTAGGVESPRAVPATFPSVMVDEGRVPTLPAHFPSSVPDNVGNEKPQSTSRAVRPIISVADGFSTLCVDPRALDTSFPPVLVEDGCGSSPSDNSVECSSLVASAMPSERFTPPSVGRPAGSQPDKAIKSLLHGRVPRRRPTQRSQRWAQARALALTSSSTPPQVSPVAQIPVTPVRKTASHKQVSPTSVAEFSSSSPVQSSHIEGASDISSRVWPPVAVWMRRKFPIVSTSRITEWLLRNAATSPSPCSPQTLLERLPAWLFTGTSRDVVYSQFLADFSSVTAKATRSENVQSPAPVVHASSVSSDLELSSLRQKTLVAFPTEEDLVSARHSVSARDTSDFFSRIENASDLMLHVWPQLVKWFLCNFPSANTARISEWLAQHAEGLRYPFTVDCLISQLPAHLCAPLSCTAELGRECRVSADKGIYA